MNLKEFVNKHKNILVYNCDIFSYEWFKEQGIYSYYYSLYEKKLLPKNQFPIEYREEHIDYHISDRFVFYIESNTIYNVYSIGESFHLDYELNWDIYEIGSHLTYKADFKKIEFKQLKRICKLDKIEI